MIKIDNKGTRAFPISIRIIKQDYRYNSSIGGAIYIYSYNRYKVLSSTSIRLNLAFDIYPF